MADIEQDFNEGDLRRSLLKQYERLIAETIRNTIRDTAEFLAKTFTTEAQVRSIAKDAIPHSMVNLDDSSPAGDTLVLKDGSAQWAKATVALNFKGDKVLYKGLFLREYDETGTIVAIGGETTPLPEGHTLKLTYDVARWI